MKARKCYYTAINDADFRDYESANNRAYYSIFHTIRALFALENADFKKHSQALGYFNKTYIHTGLIDSRFGSIISAASASRNSSDYDDHYEAKPEEAEKNIANAGDFYEAVRQYIGEMFKAENIQECLEEYCLNEDEDDYENEENGEDIEV
jgi:uncharacterized protein (UPF0332 family)